MERCIGIESGVFGGEQSLRLTQRVDRQFRLISGSDGVTDTWDVSFEVNR